MPSKLPKVNFVLGEDELALVKKYQSDNDIKSLSKAFVELVSRGLDIAESKAVKAECRKNAQIEEEQNLIAKYTALDKHGKEKVNTILNWETERLAEIKRLRDRFKMEAAEETIVTFLLPYSVQPASAGTGMFLGPDNFEMMRVQQNDMTRRAAFSVPVRGDSMEPEYHDGDVLLIEAANDICVGEVGVFTLGGQGYVKKRGGNELISLNPEYDPIPLDESVRCNGRVIGKLAPEWIQ